ncbi:gliding motility lipoprotein GldB [Arenibacter sp. GZD96]|uniref:gliding motility lipoprotein GldB n=1 Tax=Aurantibrevibacter litoralis TaxID=3106030 RepID=UPI002AFF179C|nr:gliding motility lipoprotein GldB [Arenibacter sp. GZD-96]MEA1786759.1 gliding motility lipoprotein GldB [Arenibacter sp. GZD-96]
MRKAFFIILPILWCFFSCAPKDRTEDTIAKIPIDLKISRFDQEFAQAIPQDIPNLKKKYPFLFPQQFADSIWIAKLQDTLQHELRDEVQVSFSRMPQEELEIASLFQHIKYYFPSFKEPQAITLISDVDYQNRIIWADSLLLIGLDNYLGADHKFYAGLSKYIRADLDRQYLVGDIAQAFAKSVVPPPSDRTFLANCIYYGKELYLKELLIPNKTDAQKIGYTDDQLGWAEANEAQIWRYFVERELLYSTDTKLSARFLDPAPFSKFQLAFDNESPGRIGRYMGWQIVRAFMAQNNTLSLTQMLSLPATEIFEKANYKPKK